VAFDGLTVGLAAQHLAALQDAMHAIRAAVSEDGGPAKRRRLQTAYGIQ
jgi:hypothetical protein